MPRPSSAQYAALLVGSLTFGTSSVFGDSFQSWANQCQQSSAVTSRVSQILPEDIEGGMGHLHAAGLLSIVDNLNQDEACLSVVASGEVAKPVIVAFSAVSSETQETVNPAGIARLRGFYEREHLAKRLAKMGVNLYPNASLNSKERDRVYANRAVLAGGEDHERSFAAVGQEACVVSLRPERLADHVRQNQPYVWGMLGEQQQESVAAKGDAWEFWHEVGHCAPERVASLLSGNSDSGTQLQSWSQRKRVGMVSCNVEDAAKLWEENVGRKFRHAKTLKDLNGEPDPVSMNRFIHYELIKESLADRFAQREVAARFGNSSLSCSDKSKVQHPWSTLRLAWSVRDPDARYMTWLTPWLSGLSEESQHQTLVDAHEGMMTLAKEMLPKPLVMEIQNSRQNRPDKHRISDPNGLPHQKRLEAWAAWASKNLEDSKRQISVTSP